MSEKANFSNIYKFYDLINTVLTFGFDKSWRSQAAGNLNPGSVLDLGSGTGASYKDLNSFDVTALDPDEQMLSLNKFDRKIVGRGEDYHLMKILLIMLYVVLFGEIFPKLKR